MSGHHHDDEDEDGQAGLGRIRRRLRAAYNVNDLGYCLPDPEPWRLEAACRGRTDLFLPQDETHTRDKVAAAKAICATCPVITDCAAWVAANPQPLGVYAGKTARGRQQKLSGGTAHPCPSCGRRCWRRDDSPCTRCEAA